MDSLNKNCLKEKDTCPICNGKSKVIDNVNTINSNSFEALNLMECFTCGHWWISPIPDQNYLMELYKNGSEYVVSPGYSGSDKLESKDFVRLYKKILKYFKGRNPEELNYLEIGCGSGYLLDSFSRRLNFCVGVEPGSWKPEEKNVVDDIGKVPEKVKFDILIVKDVFEHLESPLEMMNKLKSFANSNALICLSFPNKDCLMAKLFVGRWAMIRPIGHLHYFSAKSVKKMFESSGWSLIEKYSYWPAASFLGLLKSFDWKFNNPFKLIYRVFVRLFLKQIVMGKDQWHILGRAE